MEQELSFKRPSNFISTEANHYESGESWNSKDVQTEDLGFHTRVAYTTTSF